MMGRAVHEISFSLLVAKTCVTMKADGAGLESAGTIGLGTQIQEERMSSRVNSQKQGVWDKGKPIPGRDVNAY